MYAVDAAGGSAFRLTLTTLHSRGDRLGQSMEHRERRGLLERRRKERELGLLSAKDSVRLERPRSATGDATGNSATDIRQLHQ